MLPKKHGRPVENRHEAAKIRGYLVIVILCVAGWIASCSDNDKNSTELAKPTEPSAVETSGEKAVGVSESTAKAACQLKVKDNLTDPEHAKFHNLNPGAWKSRPVENGFKVESYVDAKTEFGDTVRDRFGCTVTQAPEEDAPTVVIDWMRQL